MNIKSKNKVKVEGGMASMTDLVFLLLIFFIIMSLMSNNQTPIDLPKQSDLPSVQDRVTPTVIITENNEYVVMPGGDMSKPMAFDDIQELTASVVDQSQEMKLKIAGHKNADYEAVFKVLALSQKNGWDPVLAYDK